MAPIRTFAAVSLAVAFLSAAVPSASTAAALRPGAAVVASSDTPNMYEADPDTNPNPPEALQGGAVPPSAEGRGSAPGSPLTDVPPADRADSPTGTTSAPMTTTTPEAAESPDQQRSDSGGDEETTSKKRRLRSYAVIKGGLYVPSRTFDLDTLNPNISNGRVHFKTEEGFAGEVAVGHYLLPVFALELGAGYFQSNGLATATGNTLVRVVPVTLSAKFCLPMGPFEPYGLAGIGAYVTDLDTKGNVGNFRGTSDVTYGFDLGAGFDVNMGRRSFIGLEGKYLWAEPSFSGQRVRIDGFITTVNLGMRF